MKEFKIIAISDTHNRLKDIVDKIPSGDIILHAGDATGRGETWEVERFCKEYGSLPHKHKIFTPGNHDWLFETDPTTARKLCEDNGIICLINESITIEGINIHASPESPWFFSWAFNKARNEKEAEFRHIDLIKPYWDMIPDNTNILLTHGPAYGILDELTNIDGTPKGQFVGCEELLKRIKEIKPDLHICGHIHSGYGEKHINGTSFYNVSVCDEMYSPINEITVIDYVK